MRDLTQLKIMIYSIIEKNDGKLTYDDIKVELKKLNVKFVQTDIGQVLWNPENNIKSVYERKHYATKNYVEKPSEFNKLPWLNSRPNTSMITRNISNELPKKSGKWMLFKKASEIDEVWKIIKKADALGKLGISSKVSTQYYNKNNDSNYVHVLCIYTWNYDWEENVLEIGKSLKLLYPNDKIYYKTNEDTKQGKYRKNGHTNISKYQL